VGAPYYDEPNGGSSHTSAGRAYVYLGSSSGIGTSYFWTTPVIQQSTAKVGFSVAGGFDFDGDTKWDDFIVGIPGYTEGGYTGRGRIVIYKGESGSAPAQLGFWNGDAIQERAGHSVAMGRYDQNNKVGTLTGVPGMSNNVGSAIVHEWR
jgi:hypothetical protein